MNSSYKRRFSDPFEWYVRVDNQFERKNANVSCLRKAYGFPMTSHRAEVYEMWSILLFIIRLFEFHNQNPTNVLSLICDNSSLVNTVNKIDCRQTTEAVSE